MRGLFSPKPVPGRLLFSRQRTPGKEPLLAGKAPSDMKESFFLVVQAESLNKLERTVHAKKDKK